MIETKDGRRRLEDACLNISRLEIDEQVVTNDDSDRCSESKTNHTQYCADYSHFSSNQNLTLWISPSLNHETKNYNSTN